MTDQKQKRPPPISYRPPQHLREAFEQRVRESGLAANRFITECIFGRSRHRPAELKALARILAACAAVMDEIRHLRTHGGGIPEHQLDALCRELKIIRTAIMRRMGRKS